MIAGTGAFFLLHVPPGQLNFNITKIKLARLLAHHHLSKHAEVAQ